MSDGGNNIYKYMTSDRKIRGENSKSDTRDMISYFEKSTGIFNGKGVISQKELEGIKQRAKANKNLWHGFISLDEKYSHKINTPEKCITLVKNTFGDFFRDMGLSPDNVDLICSLHKDRPTHLHIHFWFAEKVPKCKYRGKETEYRHKGKIDQATIDRMHERLDKYVEQEHYISTRREAIRQLKKISVRKQGTTKEMIKKDLIELAKAIPKNAALSYASKDMEPYRERIDNIVRDFIDYDKQTRQTDLSFYGNLEKVRQKSGAPIYSEQIYSFFDVLGRQLKRNEYPKDEKRLALADDIEKEYRQRQGDLVLRSIKFIKPELYTTKGKHKVNDKRLKRSLAISDRLVAKRVNAFLLSFTDDNKLIERDLTNRLQQIEAEIEEQRKKEEERKTVTDGKTKYDWSK